jgi:4-amino-4-deoxy-L-arabinose transferase-like glycosyltransferase
MGDPKFESGLFIANSFLIQRLSEKFFTRQSGWLVNAFYATLTFMVINTTFSRPYNSGVFFLLLAFYALLKFMRNQVKSLKWMIFLGVSFTGAMLSHYFAFVVAFVMGFSSLLFLQGKQRLYILGAGLL